MLVTLLAVMLLGAEAKPDQRDFYFTYGAKITDLTMGKKARVWIPVAESSAEQKVEILEKNLPGKPTLATGERYGNRMLYFEAMPDKEGSLTFSVRYRVTRKEVRGSLAEKEREHLKEYLKADTLVPVDGKPLSLIKDIKLPTDPAGKAQELYRVVFDHMKYDKTGTGWGRGDANHACDVGKGNCTDFHSLFISLARSERIPARFEIGFPLPEARGKGEIAGYHCWALFHLRDKGWVPVDISEASKNPKMKEYYFGNLTADRVSFSEGRDLTLTPAQDGPPLNYFIYPYVEVDGKPHTKFEKRFSFEDIR